MHTFPVEKPAKPNCNLIKHLFHLRYWWIYYNAHEALERYLHNIGEQTTPELCLNGIMNRTVKAYSKTQWLELQKAIESKISTEFSTLYSTYPSGVSAWCRIHGYCEKTAIENKEQVIALQRSEDDYLFIKTNYSEGLAAWERQRRVNANCSHMTVANSLTEIIEIDKKLKIHEGHALMIKQQKEFLNNIRDELKLSKHRCTLRRLYVDVDSYNKDAMPASIQYPIICCSLDAISKYIGNEDKYSQFLSRRYQCEQKVILGGIHFENISPFFFRLGLHNHIDDILESLSSYSADWTIILGNSGLSGDQKMNFRFLNKLLGEDIDAYKTISEDERTINQFEDFITAKTGCNQYELDSWNLDKGRLADNGIYALNSLPKESAINKNVLIIDRFADRDTIRSTTKTVVEHYPTKQVQVFYYAFLYNLSQEESEKYVEKVKTQGTEAEKFIAEYVDNCRNGNISIIQRDYHKCLYLAERYGIQCDVLLEARNGIELMFKKLDHAIQTINREAIAEIRTSFLDVLKPDFLNQKEKKEEAYKRIESFEKKYAIGIPIAEQELTVNYIFNSSEHADSYPFHHSPFYGAPVFPYRRRKNLREGVSEHAFHRLLTDYICGDLFFICNDISLQVFNGRYAIEPDISIISKTSINLRIDIEIDEPYSGYDRKPIHYIGSDDTRDQRLISVGWMVIRFSEEQIVSSPLKCINHISNILEEIIPEYMTPEKLKRDLDNSCETFSFILRWTKEEAIMMSNTKYREAYLNRQGFGITDQNVGISQENSQTQLEAQIASAFDLRSSSNDCFDDERSNKSVKDSVHINEVTLTEDERRVSKMVPKEKQVQIIYHPVRGSRNIIASPYDAKVEDVVKQYFPSMQFEEYKQYDTVQELLEQEVSQYFGQKRSLPLESSAFSLLKTFILDNGIKPTYVGQVISQPEYHIYGKIGFISGSDLYDVKVYRPVLGRERGIGVASVLPDTPRSRYAVEQTIKATIIQSTLNIPIDRMIVLEVNVKAGSVTEIHVRRTKTALHIINGGIFDVSGDVN